MKQVQVFLLILLMFCVLTQEAESGAIKDCLRGFWDRTLVPYESMNPKMCKLRPIVTIPILKITRSTRPNTLLDVSILSSTGGGFSIQWLEYKNGKWYCSCSFSPMTLLLSGNIAEITTVNIAYMMSIGLLNNKIILGLGYDFGTIKDRRRLFGAFTLGINFN